MNPFLDNMLQYVETYRYIAVFLFTFLGAVALPLPTGSLMIACGFFSTLGFFGLPEVLIVGLLGNLAGDHTGYWIARKLGEKVQTAPILGKLTSHGKFVAISGRVHKSPWLTIFTSRFMTAVAPSVNIVAGLSKYPYGKFWLFEGSGEAAEVFIYAMLGWWFGQEWQKATTYVGVFWMIFVLGIACSFLFWKTLGTKKGIPTKNVL